MNINKEEVKKIWFYQKTCAILSLIIISAFFWSCDSNDDMLIISPNEPIDTTVVVMDTTLVNAPIIQTPSPVIHLADNLDEQDQLGYCIDTRGNGFNEELHSHSCKASGGDVQFVYDNETLQICSVEFTGFCIEMSGGPIEGMSLSLVESLTDSPEQKFIYDLDNGEFRAEADTSFCLTVGDTSAAAGIYMFRTLTMELSAEIEQKFKTWVILE